MAAVAIVAAIAAAVSGAAAGTAAKDSAEYNAKVLRQESKLKQAASLERQRILKRKGAQHMAAQSVAAGKSGVDISGSVLDSIAASQASINRDLKIERIQAKYSKSAMESEAGAMEVGGRNAQQAAIIGAGSSAASTYSSMRN
jgi:hypothetical protein